MNDEQVNDARRYFTLKELLVLVTVIALGLAMLVPLIRQRQQASRRVQCTNNLKTTGLGIHNYHDIRQEICPSYITDDHTPAALPTGFITWPILILPFLESGNLYDQVEVSIPLDQLAPAADHFTVAKSTIRIWVCPARRAEPSDSFPNSPFAVGDYANVSLADAVNTVNRTEPRTWDAATLPSRAFNSATVPNTTVLNVFLPGTLGGREHRSMTSFASVVDGLSNTAFIGEKAVHRDRLGRDVAYLTSAALPTHQDGTFYYGRGGNPDDLQAPGAMAFWSRRLAPDGSEPVLSVKPRLEDPNNRFGGWHAGVTLFLMGDGDVRAVSNNTATIVLQRLGCRNDGHVFTLTD